MLKSKLTLALAAVLATNVAFADSKKPDQAFIDQSSYAVGVLMGKNLEGMVESQKEFFSYNTNKILDGVQDTLKKTGKLTDEDLKQQLEALDNYLQEQENKISAERNKATIAEGEKFRADFEKQSGVKKTASGLLYKIEKAGSGASPKAEDSVKVHYKGTLTDGSVFDSSYERGEPIEFQLNQLIQAWVEAIPLLKKGGKMVLVAPPELAYGEHQAGRIPAHSTLQFEIELLDFTPAADAKK